VYTTSRNGRTTLIESDQVFGERSTMKRNLRGASVSWRGSRSTPSNVFEEFDRLEVLGLVVKVR
jgi:hypothetical protein